MDFTFIFLWLIIVFLIGMNVVYFFLFRRSSVRTRKGLLGLLSNCLITLVALIGLIYAQIENANIFKTGGYTLFLCALFVEQVIVQWTLNAEAQSKTRTLRRIRLIMTVFVILYTLFVLTIVIFHP